MKKFFPSIAVAVIFISSSAFADITISTNTSTSSTTTLNASDTNLTIAAGGNLVYTSGTSNPAIYGENRNDYSLILDANVGQGISSSGTSGFSTAVTIVNGAIDAEINSGRITSDSILGTIRMLDSADSLNNITIAENASINNTALSNGSAILYNKTSAAMALSGLMLTNAGTISTVNSATSTAIKFDDLGDASTLIIVNSGTIDAGASGAAITAGGSNSVIISNTGSIIGSVSFGDTSAADLYIGDGGSLNGNLIFGEAHQISEIDNGSITGGVENKGTVYISASGTLFLNGLNSSISTADFTAVLLGRSSGVGTLVINDSQDVTAGANIASSSGRLNLVSIADNATLRLDANGNRAITANTISLNDGAKLYIGSAQVHGTISSATSANLGTVYFTANNTLDGDVGIGGFALNRVEISPSVTVSMGSHNIEALNIALGANSILNSSVIISGAISLDTDSAINLSNGAGLGRVSSIGAVNGASAGAGIINTKIGSETIYSNIGSSNRINIFNVETGSQVTAYNDIKANSINVAGKLNLANSSGNSLRGNLSGSGVGELNLQSFSHQLDGNLTLNSGNILSSNIINSSIAGNIAVSGVATVNANTLLKLSLPVSLAPGGRISLISGGSGSAVTAINDTNIFLDGVNTNRIANLIFSTQVSDNSLLLMIDRYKFPELMNSGRGNIYNNIAGIYNSSGLLATLQDYLDSNSVGENDKNAALDEVSPEIDNAQNRIIFDTANRAINMISNRVTQLSGRQQKGLSSGEEILKNSAWIEMLGSNTNQGNAAGSNGYKANSSGFIIGLDKMLENDLILGVAALYSNSNIKSISQSKKTEIDNYQINIYGSKEFEKFFLNAVVGIGFNRYASNRAINVLAANAQAKYSGNSYVGRIEIGKYFALKNDVTFTPLLMFTAAQNSVNSYDESGADTLNLHVRNDSANFFEGRVGAAFSKSYRLLCDNFLVPSFTISYGYDFIGDRQKATANFIGQSATFGSSAARIAQGSTKIGVGVKLYTIRDINLTAGYEYDQRSKYHSHNGFLRARYAF